MKILRFYINLPPLPGGMEKHIYSLSLNQIKQGNEVTVFFNRGNKVSAGDIKILHNINLYKIRPQFLAFFVFYLFSAFYLILNKVNVDVVHVHGDWSSLLFVHVIKKLTCAKVIVFSFHGDFLPNKFTHTKILIYLLKKVDVVLVNGHEAYLKIKKNLTGFNSKIFWRPSGISFTFRLIKEIDKAGIFKVITTANLIKRKNLHFILNLAKLLSDIDFYIVGDGLERKSLTTKINKEKISNVYLLGQKSEEELAVLLNSSDLFLLPSFAEGTSTSIIEAMVCGLPIICSNVGGIEKLIKNGENGFVIESFNEKDYLDKIQLIMNSPKLQEKIKKNNLDKGNPFYWERVSKEISVLFENILMKET